MLLKLILINKKLNVKQQCQYKNVKRVTELFSAMIYSYFIRPKHLIKFIIALAKRFVLYFFSLPSRGVQTGDMVKGE